MIHLSDDQRAILAEINADARYTAEALEELADECDDFQTLLCEIADADLCDYEYDGPLTCDVYEPNGDRDYPY